MLESLEDFKKVELEVGNVVNGVDNPSLMSADSTAVVKSTPDGVKETPTEETKEEKTSEETEEVEEEKTDKEPEDEKLIEKEKEKAQELGHGAKKKIAYITKKWRSTERELNYTKSKLAELEKEYEALKAAQPLDGRPKKEDYEFEEDYIEALIEWNVANATKNTQAQAQKAQEEIHKRSSLEAVYSAVDEVIEKGNEKYPDFEEVVRDEDLPLSTEMLEVVLDCDEAEEVLYYLGKNPDEALRIHELSIGKMAKEIAKIEMALQAERSKGVSKTKTRTNKIPAAPEPITPPKSQGIVEKSPEQMTPREYRLWREKGGVI